MPDRDSIEESGMNWEQIEGKWRQYAGQMKERWGRLTDDDLQQIAGKKDQLVGKIQERYGIAKEEVESQIDAFSKSLSSGSKTAQKSSKSKGAGR